MLKPYVAEFIGTFSLSIVVFMSIVAKSAVPTPLLAGIVLALFVYTIGHISGAHLNPAVTIGLWSIKKINWAQGIFYIIAQFAGAAVAILLARYYGVAQLTGAPNNLPVAIAEAVGAFMFAFGIASVVYGRVSAPMTGVVIGGSLAIGATLAGAYDIGGFLNPAVAFTSGAFNLAFILGPIVGSVIGFQAYKYLSEYDFTPKKTIEIIEVIVD